jgi:molecular chaperone IbpA
MNNQIARIDALNRALIGFDTMFDTLERRFANSVSNNYPPHNILRTDENQYEIQLAVTGFEKHEIAVTVEDNVLVIKGEKIEPVLVEGQDAPVYLHRGLATRDFCKEFPLAEHIEVTGAETRNGMLTIKLVRNVPESAKPKVIDIKEVK